MTCTHRYLLPIAALLCAAALGACADDVTAPARPAPTFSTAAPEANDFLVAFEGNGAPADFAARVASLGGTVTSVHNGAGIATVTGLSDAAAAQLAATSGVSDVERDIVISLDAPAAPVRADLTGVHTSSVGNPASAILFSWQWNMRSIHADAAWAAGKLGSPDVTVAILDTGIDYDDFDLNGLVDLSRSTSFVPSDDQITTTFFPSRNKISDYNGHGTNVAAEVSSTAFAFAGVTSRTTLIGVKVLGANGRGTLGGVLNGVLWAADHGADVANMSLGGAFTKPGNGSAVSLINKVFNYAKQKGMLIVVAAGNDTEDLDHNGNEFVTYCDAVHVVCVSAVGPFTPTGDQAVPAFFTNFGRSSIAVAGPGGNSDGTVSVWPWGIDDVSWVWSLCSKTLIAGTTTTGAPITPCASGGFVLGFIGTSQATPHVAGLAALLVAENGHGRPDQIKHLIEQSSDDFGQPGTDPFFGRGRIDVANALGL